MAISTKPSTWITTAVSVILTWSATARSRTCLVTSSKAAGSVGSVVDLARKPRHRTHIRQQPPRSDRTDPTNQRGPGQTLGHSGKRLGIEIRVAEHLSARDLHERHSSK